ncbi:hypothetical protein HPB50_022561 [Hyalomma asiaticum]|uniref:Uncharacterized protein n=1 Tax=Hyalomma asiaticum TaxID=266040 RepID=A0ACB7RWR9_HYAAI|nr:hypothetical protein HPB50_022561 [Hyalomma asiaticum]
MGRAIFARVTGIFAKRWLFVVPNFNVSRCISVGDTASIERTFTKSDVDKFAALTGDCNPIHLDVDYAQSKNFSACVVHGALINGLVSAVIGTKLPGPGCVVVHQVLEFPKPPTIILKALRHPDVLLSHSFEDPDLKKEK